MSVLLVQLLWDLRSFLAVEAHAAAQNDNEARAKRLETMVERIDFALRNR